MLTSSILTNIKITDPKEIETFVNSLEASENDPKRLRSGTASRQMTSIDEIRKLMSKKVPIK